MYHTGYLERFQDLLNEAYTDLRVCDDEVVTKVAYSTYLGLMNALMPTQSTIHATRSSIHAQPLFY
jgi:hypothetical protein